MSLQGQAFAAGSGKYLSAAPPIATQAGRPLTITFWLRDSAATTNWTTTGSANFTPAAVGSNTLSEELAISIIGRDASSCDFYSLCYDSNGANNSPGYIASPSLANSTWYLCVATFAGTAAASWSAGLSFSTNGAALSLLAGNGVAANGTQAFDYLAVDGKPSPLNSNGMPITTLLGSLAIWSGTPSSTDLTNLATGGAGGKGVNPKALSSANITLLNYYFDVGVNSLNDQKGGNNLAAVGGYAPAFSATDPPVNAAGQARQAPVTTMAPLTTILW